MSAVWLREPRDTLSTSAQDRRGFQCMGKRLNDMAARLRIVQSSIRRSADVNSVSLQDTAVILHGFHCELLGHNVHYDSEALAHCRDLVTPTYFRWARQIHRAAATERHDVFPCIPIHATERSDIEECALNDSAPARRRTIPRGQLFPLAQSSAPRWKRSSAEISSCGTKTLRRFLPFQALGICLMSMHNWSSQQLTSYWIIPAGCRSPHTVPQTLLISRRAPWYCPERAQ